jgi:hypothetical protein
VGLVGLPTPAPEELRSAAYRLPEEQQYLLIRLPV